MYALVITIHVIASLFLIAVILLQAGRGGGLADTLGGSQMQSLFGTRSANVLAKLTTICATLFIVTCLSLAIISSRKSRSVVEKVRMPVPVESAAGTVDTKPEEMTEEVEQAPQPEVMEETPEVPLETQPQ